MSTPPYLPNYDIRWKELIKALHKHFIQKFFPKLYEEIDFGKGVRHLDKELQKLLADWLKKGSRQGDLLLEYQLKNGKKQLVLIHVEVQHGYDPELPRRMFISYYRIRDRYPDKPLSAIAIYTGARIPTPHDHFEEGFEGSRILYHFNHFVVKNQNEQELLGSDNPIDLAILAGLYVLKIKDDSQRALQYKLKLARLCLKKGLDKQTIKDLIIFVSFLIALPEPQQLEYEKNIHQLLDMKPLTLIEEDPANARIVEYILLGKTLEQYNKERDLARELEKEKKDRQRILALFFEMDLEPEAIAKVFTLDVEVVKEIIDQAKNTGYQPTKASKPTRKPIARKPKATVGKRQPKKNNDHDKPA